MQELGDDGGDASEVSRAAGSLEDRIEAFHVDVSLVARGINLPEFRSVDEIHPRLAGRAGVALQVSRVLLQIFADAELGRVHEDAQNDEVGQLSRSTDEAEMAFV